MANPSDVRRSKVVVPEGSHPNVVYAAAMALAESEVDPNDMVLDLQLDTAHPVGGEDSTTVEWPFTYQVVPPGGSAAARPR